MFMEIRLAFHHLVAAWVRKARVELTTRIEKRGRGKRDWEGMRKRRLAETEEETCSH